MNTKNYILAAKRSASIQIKELKKINKVFNVSFTKAVDLILNCKGKVIFSGCFNGTNLFVDLSSFDKGVYTIGLKGEKNMYTEKVILE